MNTINPNNKIDVVRRFLHVLALLQNDSDTADWNTRTLADLLQYDEDRATLSDKQIHDYIVKIEQELDITIARSKGSRSQNLAEDIDREQLLALLLFYSDFVVQDSTRELTFRHFIDLHSHDCLWMLARLFFASKKGNLARFSYQSNNRAKSVLTVEPWHLVFRNNNLYLVARRKPDDRVCLFVLNRIDELVIEEDTFDTEQVVPARELFAHSISSYISDTTQQVTLRFRPRLEHTLRDIFAAIDFTISHNADWCTLECRISDPAALCKQLFLYGDDVEITGSAEVRQTMIDMLDRSWKVYRD